MQHAIDKLVAWASRYPHGFTRGEMSRFGELFRIGELIATTLADDPDIQRVLTEAADHGAVADRTRQRAVLALEDYAERHPDFAAAVTTTPIVGTALTSKGPESEASALANVVAERFHYDVVTPLFFGRDSAEHDIADGLLREGFLPTTAFQEVISGRKNLIIGRKGSGKSAICMHLLVNEEFRGRSCLITPDDAAGDELCRFELAGLAPPSAKALLWRYVFAIHAARFLVERGPSMSRRLPRTIAKLRRFLRDNGEQDEQGLYDRLARAGRGLSGELSLGAFGAKLTFSSKNDSQGVRATRQLEVIEAAVRQAFVDIDPSSKDTSLLLMVDQLEQIWSGGADSEALAIGLLLAGKHVALAYGKQLRCVFFLRSDNYDDLNFSDADKFHGDEIRLDWTVEQLRHLALRRASAALKRSLAPEDLWGGIFPSRVGGERIEDYLFERMLPRPRDAIQFLNRCRDTAVTNGNSRITESDILGATLVFSQWKVLDLAKEYGRRFPFLRPLLAAFRDSGYEYSRASIAELLAPVLDSLCKSYVEHSAIFDPDVIIELLYSVGFLGVRRSGGYVYTAPMEQSIRPTDNEFCIHPCFRPALNLGKGTRISVINSATGGDVGRVIQAGLISGGINFSHVVGGGDLSIHQMAQKWKKSEPDRDRSEVHNQFAAIVEEIGGVRAVDVSLDKSFSDDLNIDSLSMVEIAVQTEDAFGIQIPDDELGRINTVGDAVEYIERVRK